MVSTGKDASVSPKKPVPPGGSGDRPLPARLDPRLGRSGSGRSSRTDSPAGERERRPRPAGPRTRRVTVLTRVAAGVVSVVLLSTTCWCWYLG